MYAGSMHMGTDAQAAVVAVADLVTAGGSGVCSAPPDGSSSALVQHADMVALCRYNPPYGFRALCREPGAKAMLRRLANPRVCKYKSCAVVGSGGSLLGARQGAQIDAHDAVIRLNFAPDPAESAKARHAPHSHLPTWHADLGQRTTWRVMAMEGYGYLNHYGRFWLKPPMGHGTHENMSGIPRAPLLAIACHEPTAGTGRCRAERIRQTFAHQWSASYLINPLLLREWSTKYFRGVLNQKVPSTGMYAIAFASQLCAASTSTGDDPSVTGRYHNFSAQGAVLRTLAASGVIVPHWGTCVRSSGDPPAAFLNRMAATPARKAQHAQAARSRAGHRTAGRRRWTRARAGA
eukprot:CAMPEP_0119360246 /NCGR_PEP_ID=MMETSP1334-20130426/7914_1 /TAXON_ID=127549 /ORGANISM="Calcidiscus leptoporus, Strain RCC1130" /LENGTH=348 /DNA_ID=CAMNT_0007375059 /DNA_START=74 /DNA_END=1121 /DNA_ORIENTATION=-